MEEVRPLWPRIYGAARGPQKEWRRSMNLPKRYEMTQNAFKSAGAELKDLYITMGTDDWTGIVEAPSEEAMMKALLTIAGTRLAKSQTMSAVHIAKALDIIKELNE